MVKKAILLSSAILFLRLLLFCLEIKLPLMTLFLWGNSLNSLKDSVQIENCLLIACRLSNYSDDTNIGGKKWELKIIFLTIQENQPYWFVGISQFNPKWHYSVCLAFLFTTLGSKWLLTVPWNQFSSSQVEMFLASEEMPKNGSQALKAILKMISKDHFEQW